MTDDRNGRVGFQPDTPIHSHAAAHAMMMMPDRPAIPVTYAITALHSAAAVVHSRFAPALMRDDSVSAAHWVVRAHRSVIGRPTVRHRLAVALPRHRCVRVRARAMHVGPGHGLRLSQRRAGQTYSGECDQIGQLHRFSPCAAYRGVFRRNDRATMCSATCGVAVSEFLVFLRDTATLVDRRNISSVATVDGLTALRRIGVLMRFFEFIGRSIMRMLVISVAGADFCAGGFSD